MSVTITPDEGVGQGVALITGCSTGIGRATATALASAGYRVVATARRLETLDGLDVAMALRLDVTEASSIDAVVEAVIQRYGRIDVLVNNAGYALRGAVEEVDVDAVRRMFDTNVVGIIRMVRAVAPIMRRQGSGRIVNVGSLAGKFGGPANGSYAATKHAVEALSDAMRWELAPFGIQVILIEPGAIGTDFEKTVERNSGGVIARPESPYASLYARVRTANERIRASQPGPEAVASVILTAVRMEHPHARYPAAIPFAARLTMGLPDAAKDLVVRRLYGLGSLRGVTGQARSSTRSENGGTSDVCRRGHGGEPLPQCGRQAPEGVLCFVWVRCGEQRQDHPPRLRQARQVGVPLPVGACGAEPLGLGGFQKCGDSVDEDLAGQRVDRH